MNSPEIKFPNFYLLKKNHKDVLKENQGLLFPSVEFYYEAQKNAISFDILQFGISISSGKDTMDYWLTEFEDLLKVNFNKDDDFYIYTIELCDIATDIRLFITSLKGEVIQNDIIFEANTFEELIKERKERKKHFLKLSDDYKLENEKKLNDWENDKVIILEYYRKLSIEEIIKEIKELKDSGEIDERESLKHSHEQLQKGSLASNPLQNKQPAVVKKTMALTNFLFIIYLSFRSKGEQFDFNSEEDKDTFKDIVSELEIGQGKYWDDLEPLFRKFEADTTNQNTIDKYLNYNTLFNLLNQEGTSTKPDEYKRIFNSKIKKLRKLITNMEFNKNFKNDLYKQLDSMKELQNEYFDYNPSLPSI